MSFHHSPQIIQSGLVLLLDAANTKSYPGSGDIVYDLSGNSNSATGASGFTHTSGYLDNGGTGVLTIANDTSIQFTTAFTQIIGWKLNTSFGTSFKTLFGKSNYSRYGIIVEGTANNPILADFSSTSGRNAVSYVYPGYDQGIMSIHKYDMYGGSDNHSSILKGSVNSRVDVTDVEPAIADTQTLKIFQSGMDACVAHASLYNRALTEAELTQNYNALRGRFSL